MIGDLLLFLKNWFYENVFCVHDYEYKIRPDNEKLYRCCKKCGRLKDS